MMKKLMILGLGLCMAAAVEAQAPIKKGETQLNAGFGLSNYGTPIYLGLEFGLPNSFSGGIEGSYRSWNNHHYYGNGRNRDYFKYSYNIIGLGAFANYHFNKVFRMPSQWDLYAGLGLNYFIYSDTSDYYGYESYRSRRDNDLSLGGQVGARYFFSKSFGLNLEGAFGSSVSGGKFGITYKF